MKIYFFIVIFSISHALHSQINEMNTIYLDSELNQTDRATFNTKFQSGVFREQIKIQDSVVIKYLVKNYNFGKFENSELMQIQGIIKNKYKITDFSRNLIISYRDTIMGFEDYYKSIEHRKSLDESSAPNQKKYLKTRERNDKRQKKCKRLIKRKNTTPLYLYSVNLNFTYKTKHYSFQKIDRILENIFFKRQTSGIVILKPTGEYFFYRYLPEHQVVKMLTKSWSKYVSDFNLINSIPTAFKENFIEKAINENREILIAQAKNKVRAERSQQDLLGINSSQEITSVSVSHRDCFTSSNY